MSYVFWSASIVGYNGPPSPPPKPKPPPWAKQFADAGLPVPKAEPPMGHVPPKPPAQQPEVCELEVMGYKLRGYVRSVSMQANPEEISTATIELALMGQPTKEEQAAVALAGSKPVGGKSIRKITLDDE